MLETLCGSDEGGAMNNKALIGTLVYYWFVHRVDVCMRMQLDSPRRKVSQSVSQLVLSQ